MHFKQKVKCTTPIPKLKLKSINKNFGIPKSKSSFGKILKPKLKLKFDTKTTLLLTNQYNVGSFMYTSNQLYSGL